MKRLSGLVVAAALAGCASPAPEVSPPRQAAAQPAGAPRIVELQNPGFEADLASGSYCPPKWSCIMHSDATSYRYFLDEKNPASGKRSLCFERVGNEPWAQATQGIFREVAELRGKRVRLSLSMRTEGVVEGAGPWFMAHGGGGGRLTHDERLVKGTQGWERVQLDFDVPPATAVLEVGAMLHGVGRLCIDDARLEILPP
jgi:hypothetical protein